MARFVKFTKLSGHEIRVRPEWVAGYGTSTAGNYIVVHHVQIEVKESIEDIARLLDGE